MIKKMSIRAAAIGASVVLTSSAVAQANPAIPMTVIESSAAQLCGAITRNPRRPGFSAIHHVCPRHEALMMGIMGPVAAEEVCTKPT